MAFELLKKTQDFRATLNQKIQKINAREDLSDVEKTQRVAEVENNWLQIGVLLEHLKYLREISEDKEKLVAYLAECNQEAESDEINREMWENFGQDTQEKLWNLELNNF